MAIPPSGALPDSYLHLVACNFENFVTLSDFTSQPSIKTAKIKTKLAKKAKQNRPIPYWVRFRTDNKVKPHIMHFNAQSGADKSVEY